MAKQRQASPAGYFQWDWVTDQMRAAQIDDDAHPKLFNACDALIEAVIVNHGDISAFYRKYMREHVSGRNGLRTRIHWRRWAQQALRAPNG